MERRPVLYLDLDDTLISWADGQPRAAKGARELVLWALQTFEVRWLTTWCPDGEMDEQLLCDLASLLHLEVAQLARIRGVEWGAGGSKVNGIAWLEHTVQERPFVWLEDDYGFTSREGAILAEHPFIGSYVQCNVTRDPNAVATTHRWLRRWRDDFQSSAA